MNSNNEDTPISNNAKVGRYQTTDRTGLSRWQYILKESYEEFVPVEVARKLERKVTKVTGSCETFEKARLNDATVNTMFKSGFTLAEIVGQLVTEKGQYKERILELIRIAPRKITLPDGSVVVWHCPDEFVP